MTVSITDRLSAAEEKINRILELLPDSIMVDEASNHISILDTESLSIDYRIRRMETTIQTLKFMWQQAATRANS